MQLRELINRILRDFYQTEEYSNFKNSISADYTDHLLIFTSNAIVKMLGLMIPEHYQTLLYDKFFGINLFSLVYDVYLLFFLF